MSGALVRVSVPPCSSSIALASGRPRPVPSWRPVKRLPFWPKGVNLVKETSEKLYANGQEVFGVSLKTAEALGQLAKGGFEAANENFNKQVNNVKKAASATK